MSHYSDLSQFFRNGINKGKSCLQPVEKIWEKGEYLFHEGNSLDRIYYIDEGRVRVFRTLTDGRSLLYRIYLPGSILGDLEFFTGIPASSSAQCVCPVITRSFRMSELQSDRAGNIDLVYSLAAGLARKLHQNSVNEAVSDSYTLEEKLSWYFLNYGGINCVESEKSLAPETLYQLAEWMGCSYRHLTRSIASLVGKGAVVRSGKGWASADRDILENLASILLSNEDGWGMFEKG